MKKLVRKKVTFLLACASILGGKTQAMKKSQSQQTLAAVGVASNKNSNKGLINWVKDHKWQLGVGSALTFATAVGFTILGFKYFGKKNKDDNNIDKIPNVKEKNKDNIQQKEKKGKYYEKNQQMINDGIVKLNVESRKIYDVIKDLILNYKNNDLSSYIKNIDHITGDIIQSLGTKGDIKSEHREKYIKMLDEFIDIYSGKKELTKFDAEDNTNFGLNVEVQSKSIDYNIYQSEIQIRKFNDNGDVIFHMKIDLENLIDDVIFQT